MAKNSTTSGIADMGLDDAQTVIDNATGEIYNMEGGPDDAAEIVQRDEYIVMRTLTLKGMGASGGAVVNVGERVRVAQIWGRCDSWHQVKADPGDASSELLDVADGVFRGVNCVTGARYEAPVLALPSAFQPTIIREISTHGVAFEFFIEIVASPASNPSGYNYIGRMKLDSKSPDALGDMQKRWGIGRTIQPMIALRSDPAMPKLTAA